MGACGKGDMETGENMWVGGHKDIGEIRICGRDIGTEVKYVGRGT